MVANLLSENKYRAAARPPTTRDHVAPQMIRGWDHQQRARIRGTLMVLALAWPDDVRLAGTPEMRVVAMIDKENAR